MSIQITIVGTGQIGASIGLALAAQGEMFQRTGHDRHIETARKAHKLGAFDQVAVNLPSAVRQADIVVLALPADQIRPTLEVIASELKENAVLLDTGPVKVATLGWVGELLPEKRQYVGLTPVFNPAYLYAVETGLEAARADLFQRGLFAIVAPPRTSSDALQVASELVRLLGADPLFADPLEIDGLMAATYILPQLMSAALLNATVDHPGWHEARKIAGQGYAQATGASGRMSSASSLASSVLLNRENVLRLLDRALDQMQTLREDIAQQDAAALEAHLDSARKGQAKWLKERLASNWAAEGMPEAVARSTENMDVLTRLFGGGWRKKDKKTSSREP